MRTLRFAGLLMNLSNCFAGVADLGGLRVNGYDPHPNARGHRLIFESLYRRWTRDPVLWALVSGQSLQQ